MRRIVIPLVATIMLVWGLLMLPNIASSTTTQPNDDSVAEALLSATSTETNCEPLALDLYYILDLSSSMGQLYGQAPDHNKLDAAKEAIAQTNLLIDSWDNGSRMGLITYYGGQNGNGNPPTYEVVVTNQLAFRDFWGGLTDNLDDFNERLSALSANGSTPTSHALNDSLSEMSLDHDVANVPVFILLSDGVPTLSSERYSFDDSDVQAVDVRDELGGFRPIVDVRLDGGSGGAPGYFNGEPLADVMSVINDVMQERPDFTYHAIGIQGQTANTFNAGILEYVAFMGLGLFAEPDNLSALHTALEEAVIQSACPVPTVTVEVFDAEENLVNELTLNEEGWPTPNPLTATVTLSCPVGGEDCDGILFFNIQSENGNNVPRFFVPRPISECEEIPLSSSRYSYYSYEIYCPRDMPALQLDIAAGETTSFMWPVWIQPSEAYQLEFTAEWNIPTKGPFNDEHYIDVPLSQITPIMFLPGLGATMLPSYQQLSWANIWQGQFNPVARYDKLFETLEKMGYEGDKTIFFFRYDWLKSNMVSAEKLRELRLNPDSQTAATVPWVAGSPNADTIKFDFIGHSTGNLVSRAYMQAPDDKEIWNNNVRKYVSIAGPHTGIVNGYTSFEGQEMSIYPPVDWFTDLLGTSRAWRNQYCTPRSQWPYSCYVTAADKYNYMHNPYVGLTITPQFLPTADFINTETSLPTDTIQASEEAYLHWIPAEGDEPS